MDETRRAALTLCCAPHLVIFSSFHWNELMQSRSVRRPSVCLSVRLTVNFYTHTMVPTYAYIQDVLKVKVKVKGHVIRTLLWFHENRFFSQTNDWIEKHAFFRRDFGRLRISIANISRTEQDIDNRKTALQTTTSPVSADIIWWTLVHKRRK